MSNWAMINRQTGELKDFAEFNAAKQRQNDAYKKKYLREGRKQDFTASNMRNLHEVYTVLTTAQCGYLMRLQCNMNYEGVLVNSDKSPMDTADMMRVLQLTRKKSTFYDFLNACLEHDIIRKDSADIYSVNERYHFKGAFDDQYVVKSYTAKIKRVYSEVKAADIGLIYRMLPFIHFDTNTLCRNPFEPNPNLIEPFNRKQLAEAIGVSPSEISRRLPKMTFDGEYVIAQVTVGGKRSYMFNPWVFYRKDDEPDRTLQTIFNIKPK